MSKPAPTSTSTSTSIWPDTPVLIKRSAEMPWPDNEKMFYILARDGLHICRNHDFFRSCVPADRGPSELEEQAQFLIPQFPMIPCETFERVVGFFDVIAERQGSEAAIVLIWDQQDEIVRLVVPEQVATMSPEWGGHRSPIGVHYVPPTDLPTNWIPFGDIHSHVDYAAYASTTDVSDETHTAGLHIVVGRIHDEPPELHIEAVVDGTRFHLEPSQVIENYEKRRRDVPQEWIDRVQIHNEVSYVSSIYS
jgi:hypothetical protein